MKVNRMDFESHWRCSLWQEIWLCRWPPSLLQKRLKTHAHTSWPAATDCITSSPELSWSVQVCYRSPSLYGIAISVSDSPRICAGPEKSENPILEVQPKPWECCGCRYHKNMSEVRWRGGQEGLMLDEAMLKWTVKILAKIWKYSIHFSRKLFKKCHAVGKHWIAKRRKYGNLSHLHRVFYF